MGKQFLVDSNAAIDYLGGKLPAKGMSFMDSVMNAIPNISVITKIETLGFPLQPEDERLLVDFIDSAVLFTTLHLLLAMFRIFLQ